MVSGGTEILVADAHSDLLQELVYAEDRGEEHPFRSRWLEELQGGGVALQVCAVYQAPQADPDAAFRPVLRQVASFQAGVDADPEVFAVTGRRDLETVGTNGLGLLLGIEGVSSFGEDTWPLELLAKLGVRVLGLTWNEQNAFAAGCDHEEGLTELGARLVDRAPEL